MLLAVGKHPANLPKIRRTRHDLLVEVPLPLPGFLGQDVSLERLGTLHLSTSRDPEELNFYTRSVAATWLACGLDPEQVTFYRQSHIPETFELTWVLSCMTPKGLMNRAHAVNRPGRRRGVPNRR